MEGEGGVFGYVKRHPLIVAAAAVAFVLLLIVLRRGSSSAASASGVDPNAAALAQSQISANAQQSQLDAQLTGMGLQIQGQKDIAGLQAGVQIADIYGKTVTAFQGNQLSADVASKQIDAQVQESNNALTGQQTGIEAQLAGLENTNATQLGITQLQASEQTAIAATNAATLQSEIGAFADVTKTQIKSNEAVTTQYLKHGGGNSAGAVLGGVASVIGSFFG